MPAGPDYLTGKFHQTFKKEIIPVLQNSFTKLKCGEYESCFTQVPKPGKDCTRKLQINILHEYGGQHCKQNLVNKTQQYVKRIIHHDHGGLI